MRINDLRRLVSNSGAQKKGRNERPEFEDTSDASARHVW
jgi:hypothetical protein